MVCFAALGALLDDAIKAGFAEVHFVDVSRNKRRFDCLSRNGYILEHYLPDCASHYIVCSESCTYLIAASMGIHCNLG